MADRTRVPIESVPSTVPATVTRKGAAGPGSEGRSDSTSCAAGSELERRPQRSERPPEPAVFRRRDSCHCTSPVGPSTPAPGPGTGRGAAGWRPAQPAAGEKSLRRSRGWDRVVSPALTGVRAVPVFERLPRRQDGLKTPVAGADGHGALRRRPSGRRWRGRCLELGSCRGGRAWWGARGPQLWAGDLD